MRAWRPAVPQQPRLVPGEALEQAADLALDAIVDEARDVLRLALQLLRDRGRHLLAHGLRDLLVDRGRHLLLHRGRYLLLDRGGEARIDMGADAILDIRAEIGFDVLVDALVDRLRQR